MTEQEFRQSVVKTAQAWLGCKESNGTHKQIIDTYNAHKPIARGYAVKYTDAWCATYVSAVAVKLGITDIMFTECSCQYMISLYKAVGRWVENDAYTPKIGDIVMYDWDDSGSGDCTGVADHVGIVTAVNGNSMTIIEGNISNAVGTRTLAVNARYVRGYCCPDYAKLAPTASQSVTDKTTSGAIYTVQNGDTLWGLAEKWFGTGLRYREIMEFNNLKTDALSVGQALKIPGVDKSEEEGGEEMCEITVPVLRYGATGASVEAMQVLLYGSGHGLPNYGMDGEFGGETESALKQFQKSNGLTVDGVCGRKSWEALLK